MPKTFRFTTMAVLLVSLVLAACNDPQAPADEEEALIDLDVAQYVAENTSDDIVVMTTEAQLAMLPGFANTQGCERRPLSRIFCGARKFSGEGNLSISREVTFYGIDESGNVYVQEEYDAATTDSINYKLLIEGSRETTRDGKQINMTVNRQRDFTVSGLYGEEEQRTWNGTGSAEVNRTTTSDEFGTRTYDMSSTSTVENVVIAVPRAGTWPLSGTITRHVTVEVVNGLGDTRKRERTVVVTFDGSQFASIDINGEIFILDLETRTVGR